ncbi:MAG: oligosaccharide repeat unit polymerase [Euryarchaeota archaeon]|nr:oligosaccharide repeat unit polymerase [Euryarchaeota archaeon]
MIQESRFLSLLMGTARFVESSLSTSRSCWALNLLAGFLAQSVRSSRAVGWAGRLASLYPGRAWSLLDCANRRVKTGRIQVFHPLFIFPFVYLAFLSVSTYRPSNLALISVAVGVIAFSAGVLLSRRIEFGEIFLEDRLEEVAAGLSAIGALFLLLDLIHAGAVPLLDPAAKRGLSVLYTMLASLLVPGGIAAIAVLGRRLEEGRLTLARARMYGVGVLLLTTVLIGLLGFRTQIIVSILGCGTALYLVGIIGITEVLSSFFLAVLAISSVGYLRALREGTSIGFFEVIGRRAGLTLSVYDSLVSRFWVFGVNRGSVAWATFSSFFHFLPGSRLGPRTMVARIFGVQNISVTSTLYGTVVLDFGIPGIILFSLLLGFVIGLAYHAYKKTGSPLAAGIYAFLLAYTLVGVETGLVDLNVFLYFAAGALILVKSRR